MENELNAGGDIVKDAEKADIIRTQAVMQTAVETTAETQTQALPETLSEMVAETVAQATELHNQSETGQFAGGASGVGLSDSRQAGPLKWEDTPLFGFIGRFGAGADPDDFTKAFQNFVNQNDAPSEACLPDAATGAESADGAEAEGVNIAEARRVPLINPDEFVLDGLTRPGSFVRDTSPTDQTYRFINMPLPYDYDALEPYIDKLTMHLHHDRHLGKYIDELNLALAPYRRYHDWPLTRLLQNLNTLPQPLRTAVTHNGGGVYNHFFYFESLTDIARQKIIPSTVSALLGAAFGGVDGFKAEFKKKALSVFGSGYAWLVIGAGGRIEITTTANQDTPLIKRQYPLLNIDVWEHAYYLKHYNDRAAYVDDWFGVVNWHEVGKRLSEVRR
ncbi:MAG: superoxide dismutase [Firmicutes bacterium]|nr:superoxide dismutase [Bacillota bacterium]